ncbi:hypothetical protein L873DRAFT_1657145, partial [Choiromyces venosus 120613-1]
QPPLSSLPPSSQQVLFADEKGKQSVCKLVRLPHGTNVCIESEGDGQSGSETIHPAIGRVDNVTSSIR